MLLLKGHTTLIQSRSLEQLSSCWQEEGGGRWTGSRRKVSSKRMLDSFSEVVKSEADRAEEQASSQALPSFSSWEKASSSLTGDT